MSAHGQRNDRTEPRDWLAPGFIAAMPQLDDPNFRRTVVLLLRHDEDGALGLVINRPVPLSVGELCRSQEMDYRGPDDLPVYGGGPVQGESHLLVLHGDTPLHPEGSEDEVEVAPGVYLVTAREGLEALARRGSPRLRCFLGYSGWGAGQLERELAEGTWVPLEASQEFVFASDPERVWEHALRRSGIDPLTLVPGGPPS
ncbi:MAG: YqgE/AlgH family protein [Acidobacteria bacterium]|nr:YqgE/AlgH family protein [Acidobacteriota bacterium]MCU0253748.1 YqgE/AlgH family protein [Acidobacteriota bacterium]